MPDKDNFGAIIQPVPIQDGREMQKAQNGLGIGTHGDPAYTLDTTGAQAVGFNWQNGGGYGNANDGLGITVEGTGPLQRCNTPAVAFQQNQIGEVRCGNIAGTVNTNSNASGRNTPMAMQAMTVRRLTPRECERLQGFPDDYTMIPWRKKQAEDCPDGPRYKALGNSMAVNCMAWIGERIAALENNR